MNNFLSKPFGKIIVVIVSTYLLFILSIIAYNSGNGRYLFTSNSSTIILDTKTGKLYDFYDGKLNEYK